MIRNTFGKEIVPVNDEARLKALYRYEILDTPPEGAFDKIATLAQSIFKVPIALVALVDQKRVFFKANRGMGDTKSVDRGVSLCSLAVLEEGVTVFENANDDPCLLHNPLVAGAFGLRFYAGAPITTHDGYRVGTVCIVDHTPRSFSAEQRSILAQLAGLVMEELELRLSARKALGAQNEMLNMTVHDLKNPINNISGLAHLIEMEISDKESVLTYTGLIHKSAKTLNQVVQNLLDTSLNTSGETNLKLENVNLSSLLWQTIEENKAGLLKKNQSLTTDISKSVRLQADPFRLKLVLDNLISNASKYSDSGSAIDVTLEQTDGTARVAISDNGQGLTAEDHKKLFGKYSRLSATPTANESSTGLGLYIAKKIVQQHKGKIWAESDGKDKGSRFIIELKADHKN
ncbi:ATPase [Flammeovirgaceae bacterium 311]|nr:ATPase [Flammeovirgaceae bacterium 311]